MAMTKSIFISLLVHATVILAVALVRYGGRDTGFRIPSSTIAVLLHEEISGAVSAPEKIKEKVMNILTSAMPQQKNISEPKTMDGIKFDQKASDASQENTVVASGIESLENTVSDGIETKGTTKPNATLHASLESDVPMQDSFSNKGTNASGNSHAFFSMIRSAIEQAKTYPYIAVRKRLEGTVVTEFIINSRGQPENIKILKSSGYEILDSETRKIIKRAAPFPHIKEPIEIPITFSLREY